MLTVTDINDVSPVFDSVHYHVTLPENTPIDSRVLQLHATDPDSGAAGHVTYSIVSGDGTDHFRLNSETGSLSLATGLDYETKIDYS